jgi:hypothetical protein
VTSDDGVEGWGSGWWVYEARWRELQEGKSSKLLLSIEPPPIAAATVAMVELKALILKLKLLPLETVTSHGVFSERYVLEIQFSNFVSDSNRYGLDPADFSKFAASYEVFALRFKRLLAEVEAFADKTPSQAVASEFVSQLSRTRQAFSVIDQMMAKMDRSHVVLYAHLRHLILEDPLFTMHYGPAAHLFIMKRHSEIRLQRFYQPLVKLQDEYHMRPRPGIIGDYLTAARKPMTTLGYKALTVVEKVLSANQASELQQRIDEFHKLITDEQLELETLALLELIE